MTGRFTTLVLSGANVDATGTFDPQDASVDHATILFLVVQGKDADMVWTHGRGEWQRGANNNSWIGTAPAEVTARSFRESTTTGSAESR